jgi:hypothetical protein
VVFWILTPSKLVGGYQSLGKNCCHHLQGREAVANLDLDVWSNGNAVLLKPPSNRTPMRRYFNSNNKSVNLFMHLTTTNVNYSQALKITQQEK